MQALMAAVERRMAEFKNKKNYAPGQEIRLRIEQFWPLNSGGFSAWLEHEGEEMCVGDIAHQKLSQFLAGIKKRYVLSEISRVKKDFVARSYHVEEKQQRRIGK